MSALAAILLALLVGLPLLALALLALFTALVATRVRRALPARGRFVEIGGARLHYLEKGEGPAIVMIHGLGGQTGNFSHSLLDRLAEDHRVVLVDRPGFGWSTAGRGEAPGLFAQAALIAGLIDRLGLDRPLVVGHSLGGGVALALALDHPEATRGLALLAPLTQMPDAVPAVLRRLAIRSPLARFLVAWTIATPMGALRGRQALADVFAPDPAPADFPLRGGGLHAMRPSSFLASASDLLGTERDLPLMMERYGTLRVPVAILFGREDAILDPALHGERMAERHPFVRLELVEGGHMLPVARAAEAADWIRACERRFEETPLAAE